MSLPDPSAGLHAALGTTAALYRLRTAGHRRRHGVLDGRVVDQRPAVGRADDERRGPAAAADRHPRRADGPHGTFPADGDYAWVAIAVADDAEFARLAAAIGRPELAGDPRFATLAARQANEDELEEIVARWTIDPRRATTPSPRSWRPGVTAAAVRTMDEVGGVARTCSTAASSSARPPRGRHPRRWPVRRGTPRARRCARCARRRSLGQHTDEVLREVLGMADAELADLVAARGCRRLTPARQRRRVSRGRPTTPPIAWNQIVVRFSTTSASSKSSSRTSHT